MFYSWIYYNGITFLNYEKNNIIILNNYNNENLIGYQKFLSHIYFKIL